MFEKIKHILQNKKLKAFFSKYYYIVIIIIGTILFHSFYNIRLVNPFYTSWLNLIANYGVSGDVLQHYIGWEAYRLSDWVFPIGLSNSVSYPYYVSVIFTDSIPLFAFVFKVFSFLLPPKFQFIGLFCYMCLIFQALFSIRIIKKFTDSRLILIAVSVLFIYSPIMLFRAFFHTSLCSHWLLFLSLETLFLYNYYKDGKKIYYIWGLISFLCSTIHIYILAMCGMILVGYLLLDFLNTKKVFKSIKLLLIYFVVAIFSIYVFGGFGVDSKVDTEGFGYFSFNLNGFFNSQGWSSFIGELPLVDGQYEGFAYLGLGVIILLAIALISSIKLIFSPKL